MNAQSNSNLDQVKEIKERLSQQEILKIITSSQDYIGRIALTHSKGDEGTLTPTDVATRLVRDVQLFLLESSQVSSIHKVLKERLSQQEVLKIATSRASYAGLISLTHLKGDANEVAPTDVAVNLVRDVQNYLLQQAGLVHAPMSAESSSDGVRLYPGGREGVYLTWIRPPLDVPVVTLENYGKWYNIFIIEPDGQVKAVPSAKVMEVIEASKIPGLWVDHILHPMVLDLVAISCGGAVDSQAREMALGRWILENSRYEKLCDDDKFWEVF